MSLTNRPLDVGSGPDRPARETDAEDAIEITDDMIEAGVAALASYNPYYDLEEDGVRSIYIAMVRASKKAR
jgi:hypothetical protein